MTSSPPLSPLRKAFVRQWVGLLLPVVTFELFKFFFGAEPLEGPGPTLPGGRLTWVAAYYLSWLVGLLLYATGVQDVIRAAAPRRQKLLALALSLAAAAGPWALGLGWPSH